MNAVHLDARHFVKTRSVQNGLLVAGDDDEPIQVARFGINAYFHFVRLLQTNLFHQHCQGSRHRAGCWNLDFDLVGL